MRHGLLALLLSSWLVPHGAQAADHLSQMQLQEIVETALESSGAGDRIEASFIAPESLLQYRSEDELSIDVSFLDYDARTHRFDAELRLSEDGKAIQQASVKGRYSAMMEVPVLTRRIASGEPIEDADVTMGLVSTQRLRHNAIYERSDLVGKSPRRSLRAGQPVSGHEVEAMRIVAKGDLLSLHFKTPYLHIQTVVEAMESGAEGSVISVRNSDSGHILRATVVKPGIAEIRQHMILSHNGSQQ